MPLPLQSNTRCGKDIQASPPTKDAASHDKPSPVQEQTQHDHESNTRSRPNISSNVRSASASEVASPTSSSRNYKILKGVARKGYFEDRLHVYGAYPSDEEREGGSVPCESDSDGPTLEKTPRARKMMLSKSAPPSAKSREKKSLALAMAFAKLKAEYESKKSQGQATSQDDARFERAEIEEISRLDRLDKEKVTPRESRHGIFGKTQSNSRKPSLETESIQKSRSKQAESGAPESPTPRITEPRSRVPLRDPSTELREACKRPRSPDPDLHRKSRWWDGSDADLSPEFMARHWKYMEQLAKESKVDSQIPDTSPHSSPPVTTPSLERRPRTTRDISLGNQAYIDSATGEVIISRDLLQEKLFELAREHGITADIMALADRASPKSVAQQRNKSNAIQKRANEGPPEGATKTVLKKVRMDSGNSDTDSGQSDDGSKIGCSENREVDKTAWESRESSAAWVRRSKRRSRTPVKPMPAKSPASSTTPKKRGRKPGSRVVNGKVVRPSEDATPVGSKSLAEPSSKMSNTATPTPKHQKFDFSAPSESKKTTVTSSNSKKSNSSIATPAPMRIVNGFLRGGTESEFDSSSEVTMYNGDSDKKTFSFRLPPRRPTPDFPEGPNSLNRRLFRP